MWSGKLLALFIGWAGSSVGLSDVLYQGENGFQLRTRVAIAASSDDVFDALVSQVGQWWDSAHTYGGDARQLSIDARPGGCFCEQLPTGHVQHLTVSYVNRPQQLRLLGGLGPLQELGVHGAMSFLLTAVGQGTSLEVSYNVSGYFPRGTAELAPVVDRVVSEQVQRLQAHVQTAQRDARLEGSSRFD